MYECVRVCFCVITTVYIRRIEYRIRALVQGRGGVLEVRNRILKDPVSCFFRVNNCIWGYYFNVTSLYVISSPYYSPTVQFCKTNFSIFQKLSYLYHVPLRPPSRLAQYAAIGRTLCVSVGKFTPPRSVNILGTREA